MTAFDLEVEVSCAVRNELNGLRRADEVVYTCAADRTTDVEPYYPRTFPCGTWEIGDVDEVDLRDDPRRYKWPYFIDTNACQLVETWVAKNGIYIKKSGFLTWDYGYGLHHSSSRTTLGCCNILREEDVRWLAAELIRWKATHKALIKVSD
jgi:hypothetical protein